MKKLMKKVATKIALVLGLATLLLVVLSAATARVWMKFEETAYRSPLASDREYSTPRTRWLMERESEADRNAGSPQQPQGQVVAKGVGAELFEANGCYACHSLERDRKIGPGLGGIFGTTVELNDGGTASVDEEYIVESILYPEAKRVAGYDEAAMPSYLGLVSVEDARLLAGFIKGLP